MKYLHAMYLYEVRVLKKYTYSYVYTIPAHCTGKDRFTRLNKIVIHFFVLVYIATTVASYLYTFII
jgi:hypothetical protein